MGGRLEWDGGRGSGDEGYSGREEERLGERLEWEGGREEEWG